MKRFAVFAVATAAAFLLFLLAAAVAVGVSLWQKGDTADEDRPEAADTPSQTGALLAVLHENDRTFAALLQLDPDSGTAKASVVTPPENGAEHGVYSLLGALKTKIGKKSVKYAVFDGKKFAEIADSCGGLVYNESGTAPRLLTGGQAERLLDPVLFSRFCRYLAEYFLKTDPKTGFSAILNTSVNNLSYPSFYDIFYAKGN